MAKSDRSQWTIQVDPACNETLDALVRERGMTLKAFMGRVARWLANLDESERTIILRQICTLDEIGLARLIVRRHKSSR